MSPLAVVGIVVGALVGVSLTGIVIVARWMSRTHERMRDG